MQGLKVLHQGIFEMDQSFNEVRTFLLDFLFDLLIIELLYFVRQILQQTFFLNKRTSAILVINQATRAYLVAANIWNNLVACFRLTNQVRMISSDTIQLGQDINLKIPSLVTTQSKLNLNTPEKLDDIFTNATSYKDSKVIVLQLGDRGVVLLNVPDVMQATDYTCGPSSLQAVLNFYGIDNVRQSDIAKIAKTTQTYGTSPQNLYNALQYLKIPAEMKQNMTIQDVQYAIRNNRPVIVQIQAWADQGTDYKNDWEDGHYVVVIGYDKDYLYFEDPWILGSIGYIKRSQFLDRWHDLVGGVRKVYNLGIIVNLVQKGIPVIVQLE